MAVIFRFEESRMNSDKQSFQKPGQQPSNWQQKQPQQQPKPQGGHQSKPSTPPDRTAGQNNFGKK